MSSHGTGMATSGDEYCTCPVNCEPRKMMMRGQRRLGPTPAPGYGWINRW